MFSDATFVVGAHGSGLSNLLFYRPGTKVLVIESPFSIRMTPHRGLEYLCEVLHLDYHRIEADLAPYPDQTDGDVAQMTRSDYIVDAAVLRRAITIIGCM